MLKQIVTGICIVILCHQNISCSVAKTSNKSNPQKLQKPAEHTVPNISNSVGIISYIDPTNPARQKYGTGTLILRHSGIGRGQIFLVTNRHVLPKNSSESESIVFRIKNPNDLDSIHRIEMIIPLFNSRGEFNSIVKFDPDGNDLVVLNISQIFIHQELKVLQRFLIPYTNIATKQLLKKFDIVLGEEVLFIGYPTALYDKRNFSPIVRTGILATPPDEDFYFSDEYRITFGVKSGESMPEKLNGFLIDANVLGGSSGSLVLTKPNSLKTRQIKKKSYIMQSDFLVLGILTNSYFDLDNRVPNGTRANVGGVISSEQIIKTIDLFAPPSSTQ